MTGLRLDGVIELVRNAVLRMALSCAGVSESGLAL